MARNRRVRRNRKKRVQEEQEETRGYVDDLVEDNNPAPSWVGNEEDTDLWRTSGEETESEEDCDESDPGWPDEEEQRYIEEFEEALKEIGADEEDPWEWMTEYDGYDEYNYSDESNEDDP